MKDRRDEVTAAVAAAAAGAVAGAGWDIDGCHDLLHRPFAPVCWTLEGGPIRHLSLWWQYQGMANLRRRWACRVGRHRYLPYWSGISGSEEAPDGLLCLDCGGQ